MPLSSKHSSMIRNAVQSFEARAAFARFGGVSPDGVSVGGVRVVYYAKTHEGIIWMLTIYAKSEEQTIPTHILRKIKEEIDD